MGDRAWKIVASAFLLAILWMLANGGVTAVSDAFAVVSNLITSVRLGTGTQTSRGRT